MTMPFGKYKGRPLNRVPDDYLTWCLDECDNISPTLRRAIENHLGVNQPLAVSASASIAKAIGSWYRKLAMEFHPDRRKGNHEGMLAVNRARELLLEMTGGEM